MTNAQIAKKLRAVAKRAEEYETLSDEACLLTMIRAGKFFTCNEVRGACGSHVATAYRDTMIDNEVDLWEDDDIASIRVLLVCFAAALAETGDLLPA